MKKIIHEESTLCDCCKLPIKTDRWEENIGSLSLSVSVASCNPLEKYDKGQFQVCTVVLNDVCSKCGRLLANGFKDLLDKTIKQLL